MDSTLILLAAALGVTNHFFFRTFEPRNANIPFIFLALEPIALLMFLGGPIVSVRLGFVSLVFFLSMGLSIIAYRLSPLHPLAQYPGPPMNKISKLWGLWVAWRGYRHLATKKLHDTYGPYVRTGPNELSVIDATAVSQILGFGGLEKGRFYEGGRHASTPPTIVGLTGEAHATKRRVWNRAMSSAALREYDPLLEKRANQLVSRLAEQAGPVDLVSWFDLFAYDLMGDLAFGGGFEMLRDGKDTMSVGKMIREFMAASHTSGQIPWIISTLHLFPQVGRIIQTFNEFGQRLATQRIKKGGSGTKDLWYHLADEAGLEKEKPTLENSAADGIVAIVAASDTTASAMSSLIWFLLSNPEYFRRVKLELDTVFVDGDDPLEVSKHQQLRFLSACIDETLRLHPPLPSNGNRQVRPGSGGRIIAGRFIPEGTSIYVPPFSLHRNPEYFFPYTDQFVPDRWLPGANFEKHVTSAFIPFSLGSANCVGQKFARRELLMVISLLLKTFDMRFADGFESDAWPNQIHDHFVVTHGPMLVNLTPRSTTL
ncbi:cytochrome P450 [Mycena sp. CBHHK59/15]|nr:cytochrome P450 [Mycena sp. CBHHK59/15]